MKDFYINICNDPFLREAGKLPALRLFRTYKFSDL